MNKRIKKLWLATLRGGKYKQAQSKLRDGKSYCCLGVLCDIHRKEVNPNKRWRNDVYLSEESVLPDEVIDWAGLSNYDPSVDRKKGECSTLAGLNDEYEFTFEQIAQVIEEQF